MLFFLRKPEAPQCQLTAFHQRYEALPTDIVKIAVVFFDALRQLEADINQR